MTCGLAGPKFQQPALGAIVADAATVAHPHRPVQSVTIGAGIPAARVYLGASAAPTAVRDTSSLEATLSQRSNVAWAGLREREAVPRVRFDGSKPDALDHLNPMDALTLRQTRRLRGGTTSSTAAFYERFYETYASVSNTFAADLVSTLEAQPGWENFTPTWSQRGNAPPYGVEYGLGSGGDSGTTWRDQFDLALRFFKADLCSAVSIRMPGTDGFVFDTHSTPDGHSRQFLENRTIFEMVGRLLHEMDATPVTADRSLLDDTLVVVYSEFSRTWARRGGSVNGSDHWPTTSVLYAGGGTRGNRQIGNFDFTGGSQSPVGAAVDLIDEDGAMITRPPLSRDHIFTALHAMGITDFFVPGGPGQIEGVCA